MSVSGAAPAVEAFLADFHDRDPGGTPRAYGALTVVDAQGRHWPSTYHALAQGLRLALPGLPPGPVLDLGCGDGHLMRHLEGLLPPQARLALGADLSRGELAAARRQTGAWAAFIQARAQQLPLPSGSVAAVLSHMALMLMSPPQDVLQELQRVLRPGGLLLALVPQAPAPDAEPQPPFQALRLAVQDLPRGPRWQDVRFEGRCWRDPDALRALLAPGFEDLQLQPLRAVQRLDPPTLWRWLTGMYDLHLLAPGQAERAHARWRDALAPHVEADGQVPLTHSFLLVGARARPQRPLS